MHRDDTPKTGRTGLERRSLLKGLGLGAAGAAAVAVTLRATPAEVEESQPERVKSRYRETEHVKRFYALNRL
ncbi:twin-arginine translocation signal domain-containing protein [Azospirillum isscasi]|uniref:Twin-arginine translocation signal domain-containing protein n=1 Tax=Azospirillum isscasi TaxID=3053926 RepID=A0ABU0WMY6_9PROT|nr:twin-arginine translocation signal domain-containing protein [Azospirillum isscasi]MDQ2105599.1 twin-arginine translocation signal domain-containing protein [Azospirillum isscasi]